MIVYGYIDRVVLPARLQQVIFSRSESFSNGAINRALNGLHSDGSGLPTFAKDTLEYEQSFLFDCTSFNYQLA